MGVRNARFPAGGPYNARAAAQVAAQVGAQVGAPLAAQVAARVAAEGGRRAAAVQLQNRSAGVLATLEPGCP
jgi:hypothetical protein